MRLLVVLLSIVIISHAVDSYEIQLFATKSNNFKGIQRVLNKGKLAGLECYKVSEKRVDGDYSFVRCAKSNSYKKIQDSINKAKKAGLGYFLLKKNTNKARKTFSNPKNNNKKIDTFLQNSYNNIDGLLFGNNEELIQILHNKNQISKDELERRKNNYLANISSSEEISGLSLRANGSNNFDIQRFDYNVRLQWDIFNDGYIGSKKDVQKFLLKKELEYERIMDKYRQSNMELSLYKIHFISNYINYTYLRQQEQILYNMVKRAEKKYDAALITADIFFKRKKAHDNIKTTLAYYESIEKEPYDKKLKPLISKIEYINLAQKEALINHAYQNSFEYKNSLNSIKSSAIEENWIDRLKTNVYVEQKKIVYLNNSETVAGLQVQLPLDFNKDNKKYRDLEIESNMLKLQSLKRVIKSGIDEIYSKIYKHKSYIKTLKGDINLLKNKSKAIYLKSKFPLEKQKKDFEYESQMINITISKRNQEIWQERTEILKLLLKLQNISGVQMLS